MSNPDMRAGHEFAMARELPPPLFSRREHLVQEQPDGVYLCQLNRRWKVSDGVDWQLKSESPSTHLERLAFHYLEFVEAVDGSLGERIILDWIHENPPWQPGYWLDSWNSYAVSIRSVCMMQWMAVNQQTASATTHQTIAASVIEQIRFLRRNLELDIRGNHLVKNIKALIWAGRCFAGKQAEHWLHTGRQLLWQELRSQFLSDGMHFELSPAYHCQVFADFLDCASVMSHKDRRDIVMHLKLAAQVIADLNHPDEKISLFGDAGLNMTYSPAECLDAYEQLGGVRPFGSPSIALTDSGYYGLNTGECYLLFDCGPSCADSLPAHGHGDILAFEWDVCSRRIIVDAGVLEYEPGPNRKWNRSTQAHNTVTVGNRDQCEFNGSFRVGYRAHGECTDLRFSDDGISVTGAYTALSNDGQEIQHSRTIAGTVKAFRVVDRVDSKISEVAVSRLLLHHDCEVKRISYSTVVIMNGTTKIRLVAGAPVTISLAKWSPDFGEEYQTRQLEIEYGETPCEVSYSLTVENE